MTLYENKSGREPYYEFIPWNSKSLWQEANQSMSHIVRLHRRHLSEAVGMAKEILSDLQSTFSLMDELCAQTCPKCPEPCCLSAKLWFDFKDLVFLNVSRIDIPDAQPLAHYDDTCRYLGFAGCTLPRRSRPWVFTYYRCPVQTSRLRKQSRTQYRELDRLLEKIKNDRKKLEDEYVRQIIRR